MVFIGLFLRYCYGDYDDDDDFDKLIMVIFMTWTVDDNGDEDNYNDDKAAFNHIVTRKNAFKRFCCFVKLGMKGMLDWNFF